MSIRIQRLILALLLIGAGGAGGSCASMKSYLRGDVFQVGVEALKNKSYAEAAASFSEVKPDAREYWDAQILLGYALKGLNKQDEAFKQWSRVTNDPAQPFLSSERRYLFVEIGKLYAQGVESKEKPIAVEGGRLTNIVELKHVNGLLLAISADQNVLVYNRETRKKLWERPLHNGGVNGHPVPAFDNELVYLIDRTGASAFLRALAIPTGQEKWSVDLGFTPSGDKGFLSPVLDGAVVYCRSGLRGIAAFDKSSGNKIWTAPPLKSAPENLSMTARYVCAQDGLRILNCVLKKDGTGLWTYPLKSSIANGVMAHADDRLYVSMSSGLYALDVGSSNSLLWRKPFDTVVFLSSPLLVGGGKTVVVERRDTMVAFDAMTGEQTWETKVPADIAAGSLEVGTFRPVELGSEIIGFSGTGLFSVDSTTGKVSWAADFDTQITAAPVSVSDAGFLVALGGKRNEIIEVRPRPWSRWVDL